MSERIRISTRYTSLLLSAVIVVPLCAGCAEFGSHRLDCETPFDHEIVVLTEPPLPRTREVTSEIPMRPAGLYVDRPDYEKLEMSIPEAIEVALRNNKELKVNRHVPHESNQRIINEDSAFDPLLQFGGGWQRTEGQVTNVIEGPGESVSSNNTDFFGPPRGLADQLRISKKTRHGGEVATNFGSTYSFSDPGGEFLLLNPAIRSALSFHIEEPLMRGAGRDVNTISVRVARQTHHAAVYRLEIVIEQTVRNVVTSYWDLYGAIAELVSLDLSVHQARETWEKEKEKLELGESAAPDVADARAQLERFRANRVLARKRVADAERALRNVLGMPHEDGFRITPTATPRDTEYPLDWEQGVYAALRDRPALRVREAMIAQARLRIESADDGLSPELNAYAGYSINGAADKFDDSVKIIASNEYTTWWAGFRYEKQFGFRKAKSVMQEAELGLSRERRSLELARQEILTELHEAYQGVTSSWAVIQRQRERQVAAAEVLEARKGIYEIGESSLDVFLRATASWSISMAEERRAVSRYNESVARWEYAIGRILDSNSVEFEDSLSDDPVENDDPETGGAEKKSFLQDYLNPPVSRLQTELMGIAPIEDDSVLETPVPKSDAPIEAFPLPENPKPEPAKPDAPKPESPKTDLAFESGW